MNKTNTVLQKNNDIGFQTADNKKFRLRAAAIIIENNEVLFAANAVEKYYYTIGGAIELGETAEQAIVREVLEETGVRYEIERLAFIQENFFSRNDGMLKGLSCHEIIFYFLMKPRYSQQLNSNSYTADHTIKEEMVWLPLDKLDRYEAYPFFFREKLKNIPPNPEHIVTIQK